MMKKYLPPMAEITWLESADVLLSASTEAEGDNLLGFDSFFKGIK